MKKTKLQKNEKSLKKKKNESTYEKKKVIGAVKDSTKFVIAKIDRRLLEHVAGSMLLAQFQQLRINYRVIDHDVALAFTISRLDPDNNTESPETEGAVILDFVDFVPLLKAQLLNHKYLTKKCTKWKEKLKLERLNLLIYGDQKQKTNKRFKSSVHGDLAWDINDDNNKVSRIDVETALLSANMESNINHRILSDPSKVASYLVQLTKAVAEMPYKLRKCDNSFSWYAEGSNVRPVKVNKNYVGLSKLWHQQLRQFSLVGTEVAQAIITEYPSPFHLMQAYKERTTSEGVALLSDIPVRRGVGPLVSSRRIGPELSRKIYNFFTSSDPNVLL